MARGQDDRRDARRRRARPRRFQQFQQIVRYPPRRLWRRAEVSAAERAAVPAARIRAHRQRHRAGDGGADAAGDGARRHARSHRRRLSSLLGGRQLARAALREDALRPGADRAGVSRGGAGRRRSVLRADRRRHAAVCAARHDRRRAAASIRRRMPTACRPTSGPQDSGPQARTSATRSKAPSTSGPPTRSARSSATTAPVFVGRYGVLPNGNAPFDPQHEFVNKNLLTRRSRSPTSPRRSSKTPIDVAESLLRARQDPVRRARAAAASAARRQGADGVERPDDRRVRARLARARRRARSGRRTPSIQPRRTCRVPSRRRRSFAT